LTKDEQNITFPEEYFEMIAHDEHPGHRIIQMILLFTELTFFYGAIMVSFTPRR
jgi:hypothetical protein